MEALTTRERDIAKLADFPNKEIAKRLGISVHTVNTHFENIRAKLGVTGKTEIHDALAAINRSPGLITPASPANTTWDPADIAGK